VLGCVTFYPLVDILDKYGDPIYSTTSRGDKKKLQGVTRGSHRRTIAITTTVLLTVLMIVYIPIAFARALRSRRHRR
jgi:hypothetical protein